MKHSLQIWCLIVVSVVLCQLINESSGLNTNPESKLSHLYEGNFTTQLDHSKENNRTVVFKYYANLRIYEEAEEKGPIYIHVGDTLGTKWIEEGLMVDIARYSGAALFTFDRRYYGSNIPAENATLDNLKYLTLEQTVNDVVTFIHEIRKKHLIPTRSHIILWGSGTGAVIAAATRKKHPLLIKGAWASSGLFDFAVESYKPYDVLQTIIIDAGDLKCNNRLKSIFDEIKYLIERKEDWDYLKERFNLCNATFDSNADIATFFDTQYNYIMSYVSSNHFYGAESFCRDIVEPFDGLNAYARWVKYHYGDVEGHCFNISYNNILVKNSGVQWNSTENRQDYYWQCTQMGNFAITDNYTFLPNMVESDYRRQLCKDILGETYDYTKLNSSISDLKREFNYLKYVTNVVYTNGYFDPWNFGGIKYPGNLFVQVVNLPYYGKSADLTKISERDSEPLSKAKRKIKDIILRWS